MSLKLQQAIANLDSITSLEDPDEIQKLDESINHIFSSQNPELGSDALLRVLERFPNDSAFGLFWSILSGLERLPKYEERLIESVRRQPSTFGLLMVNRMLNAGVTEVNGVNLLGLLKEVAADERQLEEIRLDAQGFIEWQESER